MSVMETIQKWMRILSPLVLCFGLLLVVLPVVTLYAQNNNVSFELKDMDRRMSGIEQLVPMVQSIDRRVTILETLQKTIDENNIWYRGTSVGTGLLIIAEVIKVMGKRRGS